MDNRLNTIRCFLLDMDGTFYLGDTLLPGAVDFLKTLNRLDLDYCFLTNNSSKNQQDYVAKLRRLGVEVPANKIFTSGEATAITLQRQHAGARLYVVGTPALEQELQDHGFILTDQHPDFAVLGFDTTLTYAKLWKLCDLVTAGVPYIATHPDINCPTETGFMPDIGAMMALIQTSTGHQPDQIIGKPHAPIVAAISEKLSLPIDALCMVGDRLYTDIALGQTGLTTVLVLSGETHADDVAASAYQPDYIFQDLAGLNQALMHR